MPMYFPDLKSIQYLEEQRATQQLAHYMRIIWKDELSAMGIELAISEDDYDEKLVKYLSERLPEHVFNRIYRDIGQASMCWEYPEKAGVFDEKKALDIAFGLCRFIADVIEEGYHGKLHRD